NGLISFWQRFASLVTRSQALSRSGKGQSDAAAPDVGEPRSKTNGAAAADAVRRRLSRVSLMQRPHQPSLPKDDLLRVENIKVLFDGFQALDIDEFSVGYYELRVIIGPNGAGKTTLCDVISGKTRASTGRVLFAAHDITTMAD